MITTNTGLTSVRFQSRISDGYITGTEWAYGTISLRDNSATNTLVEYGLRCMESDYHFPHLFFKDGEGNATIMNAVSVPYDTWIELRADIDWSKEDAEGKFGEVSLFYREPGETAWTVVTPFQNVELNLSNPADISTVALFVGGNGDDAQLDDLRFIADTPPNLGLNTNLLLNAEASDPGGFGWRVGGAVGDTYCYSGAFHLRCSDGQTSQVYQVVNLLDQGISPSEIDAGNYYVAFGGKQHEGDADWHYGSYNGHISIDFLDSTNGTISKIDLAEYTGTGWNSVTGDTDLPAQTRAVRYSVSAQNGYLDDAYLTITDIPQEDKTLTVVSAHGLPEPPVGDNVMPYGTTGTCTVEQVFFGLTNYYPTGWTMTGNEPLSGTTNWFIGTLTNDAVLTWNWATNYWLEFSTSDGGSVDLPSDFYAAGSEQVLTATPNPGWLFMGWSGDASGTNEAFVTMNGPKFVTATFSIDADNDGLTNDEEAAYGSNPWNPDTDGDGFDDDFEAQQNMPLTIDNSAVAAYIQNNDDTFGLYPSNVVLDVALGEILVDVAGTEATLSLQLETSDDLNTWSNAGPAKVWSWTVDGEKQFFRVKSSK
jgi:hypothetical protein